MNKVEKVLSFSPYAYWQLHALYEVAMCHNLQWRGHSFHYVTCDGLLSDCDIYWEATVGPRPASACGACQAQVKKMLEGCRIPNTPIGKYKRADDVGAARRFVDELQDHELLEAVYNDHPIASWVKSSVHSHLRLNTIDLANPKHCSALRSYLYSGVLALRCIDRMLEEERPTIMLLFNGRMSVTRVALELAKERGIRVVCHERGLAKETLLLWENESCLAHRPYTKLWNEWGSVPLTAPEVRKVTQWLTDRSRGANLNWKAFSVQSSLGAAEAFLEANRGKKIWSLFTSSTDEIVAQPEHSTVFGSQTGWISETVAIVRRLPDVALVIRVHPNSGGKKSTGRNLDELKFFQQLQGELPQNVFLVMPDDKVSTYALIDRTDVGLVYASTVALEMACRGKHVLLAGRTPWMFCESIELLNSAETYAARLGALATKTFSATEAERIATAAYRFAYAYVHRWNIRFPLVQMPDIHNGTLAVKTLEELKPGVHECLDYCTDIVLGIRPSVPVATAPVRKGADQVERSALQEALRVLSGESPMPKAIRASVVITCYNYGKYLRGCVQSVASQTFRDFELIIVNDGSTDDSQKVAEACLQEFSALNITLLNQPNSGQPALARNAGIRRAKGEFILPIDADDQIDPSYLEEAFKVIDANPNVDLVCAESIFDDGKKRSRAWPGRFDVKALSAGNQLVYCCVYRRALWEKVGGYRDNVRGYEDWDFWLALCLAGAKAVAIKSVGLIYNQKDTGVYAQTVAHHETRIAQIILNNRAAYTPEQVQKAHALIHGRNDASGMSPKSAVETGLEVIAGKKVLVYSDDPGLGGAAHYNHTVLLALARAGAQVFSAQPKSESPLLREQQQAGVSHHWISYDPVQSFARSFTDAEDAKRIFASVAPDLIYFSDCCAVSSLAAKQVALQRGIPFAVICHSEAGYLAERCPQVLPAVKSLLADAKAVIAVSENSRDVLRRHFGLAADKGTVIHSGRPARYFAPPEPTVRKRLRAELGLKENDVVCFTAARIDEAKGHQLQVEAARVLKADGKLGALHFVWAGDGEARAGIERLIAEYQLTERIHVLGYRWDIAELMDASDIFVLPSLSEALPLCIMEAMAKGLPVIASAVGGIPEELGDTGKLLPDPKTDARGAVVQLARTLLDWSVDAAARRRAGEAGRRRAVAMFDEALMTRRTLAVLAQALGERVPSRPHAENAAPGANFQDALRQAEEYARAGCVSDAIAEMERAQASAPDAQCRQQAQEIIDLLRNAQAGNAPARADATPSTDFFEPSELASIQQAIAAYTSSPTDAEKRGPVQSLQQELMKYLVTAAPESLEPLFEGNFGTVFRGLVACGLASEPMTELSTEQLATLDAELAPADPARPFDFRLALARMLCAPAHRGAGMKVSLDQIPAWLLEDYFGYVLHAPAIFVMPGEVEQYCDHMLGWVREIHRRIRIASKDKLTAKVACFFATNVSYIPLYFSNRNTRELAEKRAAIMEFAVARNGAAIDAKLPKRHRGRAKIKVGFLNAHFGPQTETHVTLPTLQLDRSRFEICLFAIVGTDSPIESHCRSFADSFTLLPHDLHEQAAVIRAAELDVLIIGTNVTAVTNPVSLLALHRLAPLQLVSYCSPVSTGMRHVDGYLTGTLNNCPGLQEHFSEKLYFCEGPPGCLDYAVEPSARSKFDRASIGVGEHEVVFVNAAACFKILPEMQETWAKILQAVPQSRLLLLPFNPNWKDTFPVHQFQRTLAEACARHGVACERLVLSNSLPARADVKALEALADVYLDTAPFSGSISVIDPLELGIPTVVWEGKTHRSRMAAALLRELGIPELIVPDEATYIALSVRLATDAAYRREVSGRIRVAMDRKPTFVNPTVYAQRLGDLLESLVCGKKQPHRGNPARDREYQLASA